MTAVWLMNIVLQAVIVVTYVSLRLKNLMITNNVSLKWSFHCFGFTDIPYYDCLGGECFENHRVILLQQCAWCMNSSCVNILWIQIGAQCNFVWPLDVKTQTALRKVLFAVLCNYRIQSICLIEF